MDLFLIRPLRLAFGSAILFLALLQMNNHTLLADSAFWEKKIQLPKSVTSKWVSSAPSFDMAADGALLAASCVLDGAQAYPALFKFAADGTLLWQKNYAEYPDCDMRVKAAPQGGAVLCLKFKDPRKQQLLLRVNAKGEIQGKAEVAKKSDFQVPVKVNELLQDLCIGRDGTVYLLLQRMCEVESEQKSWSEWEVQRYDFDQKPTVDQPIGFCGDWRLTQLASGIRVFMRSNSLFLWTEEYRLSEPKPSLVGYPFDIRKSKDYRPDDPDSSFKVQRSCNFGAIITGMVLNILPADGKENIWYMTSVDPATKTQSIQRLSVQKKLQYRTIYHEPIYQIDQSIQAMAAGGTWPKTPFFVASLDQKKESFLVVDGCRSVRTRVFENGTCVHSEEFTQGSSNPIEHQKERAVVNTHVGVAEAVALLESPHRLDLIARTQENLLSSERSFTWMAKSLNTKKERP